MGYTQMSIKKSKFWCALLLAMISIPSFAQKGDVNERAFPINFRVNSYFIDKTYMNNSRSLFEFKDFISSLRNINQIDSIVVNGTCSVEGRYASNYLLARRRAESVKKMILLNSFTLDEKVIKLNVVPENWIELINLIKKDYELPFQDEVLSIATSDSDPDRKEYLLKKIHGGIVWKHIRTNYLPLLRKSSSALRIVYKKKALKELVIPQETPQETPPKVSRDTLYINKLVKDTVVIRDTVEVFIKPRYKPLFALKTNLLYDAVTALNFELEIPFGKRWSISAEWICPWWLLEKEQYSLEFLNGNLEARYWLGNRKNKPVLTGWFLGGFVGAGLYDLEWKDKGYQGEFITTGLSGGFSHTLNKRGTLRMEYSLGLGYLKTDSKKYVPEKCFDDRFHLIYQRTDTHHWFGPVKAKVSIVWLFNKRVIK